MTAQALTRSRDTGWIAEARVLLIKDFRAEMRTRVAINSVGLFAFASLLLIALATRDLQGLKSLNTIRLPLQGLTLADIEATMTPAWSQASKMGLLWTLLCFAAFTGLSHSFVHEEETGTITALRMSISPAGAYAGKLAFNLVLLIAIAAIVTPFYITLTGMDAGRPFVFILVMLGGCIGLGSSATIIAALAAKARGSGALFGAIGLPVVTVLLMLLLNAAKTLYDPQATPVRLVQDVGGLLSFGVLLITVSAFVFRYVWEE